MPKSTAPLDRQQPARGLPRFAFLMGVLLVASLALGACSSGGSSGTAAGTTGPGAGSTPGTVAPAARALLTRLATEGSDAVFDQRFGGALDAGGEAGPFVVAGRTGDQAVVYVCDGTSGAWFTGTVGSDGAGSLRATDGDGDATVTLAPVDGGLRTSFEGGTFGGRSTTAARLEAGEGQLIRLEATAPAGGADAAAGGIIISPAGVRGVFTTSITDGSSNTLIFQEATTPSITDGKSNTVIVGEAPPSSPSTTCVTSTVSDGNSNTVIVGEAPLCSGSTTSTTCVPSPITDGNSNTVIVGEVPLCSGSTTSTTCVTSTVTDGNSNTVIIGETPVCSSSTTSSTPPPSTPTDGSSNTLILGEPIVSKTARGTLTVRIVVRSPSTTTTTTATKAATDTATCAARVGAIGDLVRSLSDSLKRSQGQLDDLLRQRDALATKAKSATGAERDAAQKQLDGLDRTIAKVRSQIDHVVAQIEDLKRQIAPCQTASSTRSK